MHIDRSRTTRSTAMGKTTDKMKRGIKDAAGAVKQAAEKGKEDAVWPVGAL